MCFTFGFVTKTDFFFQLFEMFYLTGQYLVIYRYKSIFVANIIGRIIIIVIIYILTTIIGVRKIDGWTFFFHTISFSVG